jgi:WD40 repeat protein
MLATGSQTVQIYEFAPNGMNLRLSELGQQRGDIYGLAWSPDGHFIAAGTTDQRIYLYSLDVLDARSDEDWLKAAHSRLQTRGAGK